MNPRQPEAPPVHGQVAKGLMIGFALQVLPVSVFIVGLGNPPIAFVPPYLVAAMVSGIAVVQLIYIVPAVLYFRKRGQHETAKGLWIAASIVALLNVSCWGLLLGGAIRVGG